MDGSAVNAITSGVSATNDGLLAIFLVGGGIVAAALVWHLRECSRKRGEIYSEMRRMDRLLHKIAGKLNVDVGDD